jgi:hypothetical protein
MSVSELPIQLVDGYFHPLATDHFWQLDCEYEVRSSNCSKRGRPLLGELMHISTDTLIDMLYIILADDFSITANNASEIEQIQRELQRRGGDLRCSFQSVN